MSAKHVEDAYPLAPLQEGMLFHDLYASHSRVHVEQVSIELHGDIDVDCLESAWDRVVDRHPILRTAFAWKNLEAPVQVVGRRVGLPFERKDWRSLGRDEQEQRLRSHLDEERRRGFLLSKAPLMRLGLMQTAADVHILVWSFHHLLLYGWSVGIVLKDVVDAYEALRRGHAAPLERPRPYRDYIAWLQRQDLVAAESFWRGALRGVTSPTPLPTKRSADAPSDAGSPYGDQSVELSPGTTSDLRALARKHRLTLSTIVQGAWALLLSRYSAETDVLFGTTVSGRPPDLLGVEGMVGLFINSLPVRAVVRRDALLVPWLLELQSQQVEREQYAYSPLVAVQGWSDVPRGIPLFESLLVFENFPVDASLAEERAGLRIGAVRGVEQSKFPLTVVAVVEASMTLKAFYDRTRFDAATIARLLGHLGTLLAAVGAKPEQRLGDLRFLTELEWRQLVVGSNVGVAERRGEDCIHDLVEAQAERTPEAIAVISEGEQLTYRVLDARANQLAHHLRRLGVGPEVLVGICLEPSSEMLIALLGTLKAGGAYVPLDPSYPCDRIAFMLDDARTRVILTRRHLRRSLPEHRGIVCLDDAWRSIDRESEQRPPRAACSDNLAYVIYTSGSTGRPKGVGVTHGNVVNHCLAQAKSFGLRRDDRALQFASISFDAAVEEIFPTWSSGASLVLRPEGPAPAAAELASFVRDRKITVLNLPTAYWHEWVHGLALCGTSLPPCLRLVVVGGEAASTAVLDDWRALSGPSVDWMNTYGPTEATVVAVSHRAEEFADRPYRDPVPLGRPLPNVQTYVLDADRRPVPIDIPGELYIGGSGVARGYVGRAALTADRFVPHPFAAGQRLYRTGDNARWNNHGELEIVGRSDDQVKLRGYRVEPGEIESALSQHPGVQRAAVAVHDDGAGGKRLVGYVVHVEGEAPTGRQLHDYLRKRLPAFMVPAEILPLTALPLTPNGKLDRRALPLPEARLECAVFEAPRTELEAALARIWSEVLRVPQVGPRDNFFELGGHSLIAVRLCQRARRDLGKELPLSVLFSRPTVHEVAQWMVGRDTLPLSYRTPLRSEQGAKHLVAFAPTVLGHGSHYGRLASELAIDCAMATCRIPGTLPGEEPLRSVEDIAAHCRQQLIVAGEHEEWSLVGWSFGGVVAYEMARQMLAEGLPLRRVVLIDAFLPRTSKADDPGEEAATLKELRRLAARSRAAESGATSPEATFLDDSFDLEAASRVYRANVSALRAYAPKPCSLPIADVRAARTLDGRKLIGPPIGSFSDRYSVVTVPGDHESIFAPEHLPGLARAVKAALRGEGADPEPRNRH